METVTLNVPDTVALTDEQFYYLCVANEEWRMELSAEGELIIMSPTGGESGIRNASLIGDIIIWNRQTNLGYVFDSSTIFRLPNGAKRSPDVSWVKRDRWEALSPQDKKRFPPLCPDFLIELRSESDRLPQLQTKMQEYLTNGCRLGWLIDPLTPQIEIYRPSQPVETLTFSTAATPPTLDGETVLPGLNLDLSFIFNL
ncbi:MAG: Uma2 family endonuclease [Oscillatoria sp. PMC 1051.18]|uniref:Uma2 family endonuclease n=1 Tax=Oscillatoria salina TaxID=331517 RepID=UPI0013B8E5CB|nr:Uma2 family endonuclease [Oscillatoria salina]MBZ8180278.1 Uma2 family endonuclease [Oscillatoria salina IIICB1]MEC4895453.1 Uma2 family endonuclease [Oscillatoria sp. PMC 1050.18]MEC5032097.1 Uma2 family endonuclease [Oscillatoria sp. PMC 1051.18]NET87760.1 Uma2 family endonuclease [Kamptonema sp. SIO1D9]